MRLFPRFGAERTNAACVRAAVRQGAGAARAGDASPARGRRGSDACRSSVEAPPRPLDGTSGHLRHRHRGPSARRTAPTREG